MSNWSKCSRIRWPKKKVIIHEKGKCLINPYILYIIDTEVTVIFNKKKKKSITILQLMCFFPVIFGICTAGLISNSAVLVLVQIRGFWDAGCKSLKKTWRQTWKCCFIWMNWAKIVRSKNSKQNWPEQKARSIWNPISVKRSPCGFSLPFSSVQPLKFVFYANLAVLNLHLSLFTLLSVGKNCEICKKRGALKRFRC